MKNTHQHIFVINLEKDIKKKEYIKSHFREHGIEDYSFIKAVDGRKLSSDQLVEVYDENQALKVHGRLLARGEIGCALSHLECYRKIISQDLPGAFIFEDDVVFTSETRFLMGKIYEHCSKLKSGVVLLGYAKYVCKYKNFLNLSNKYRLKKIYKAGYAHSYFITREAAEQMLSLFSPISFPIDIWKRVQDGCAVDVYSCFPYCVKVLDDHVALSSIDAERYALYYHPKPWYKRKFKQIRDFMSRLVLYKLSEYLLGVQLQSK